MFFWDSTIILLIPAMLLAFWAQYKVKSAYAIYSRVVSAKGTTSDEAARAILDANGLYNVRIEHIPGDLTDHYDPRAKVLRLSASVANSRSIAAIGVAAHECGHAIQDSLGYAPLRIRNAIVPSVNLFSMMSMPLFFIGFIFGNQQSNGSEFGLMLMNFGIILFSATLVFHLITLPVEFDASGRALKILKTSGLLGNAEVNGAKKVLSAAAMTYVAAAVMSLMQILRLIALRNQRRN